MAKTDVRMIDFLRSPVYTNEVFLIMKKALKGITARKSAKEREPLVRGSCGNRVAAGPEPCTGEVRRFPR